MRVEYNKSPGEVIAEVVLVGLPFETSSTQIEELMEENRRLRGETVFPPVSNN